MNVSSSSFAMSTAEQPPSILSHGGTATPTCFLLECGGWGFPEIEANPFDKSSPLTPPSPTERSSHEELQQQQFYYMSSQQQRPPTPPNSTTFATAGNPIYAHIPQQPQTQSQPQPQAQARAPAPPPQEDNTRPRRISNGGRKRRSEDMSEEEDEQRKKLLERNRVAASKCRQKKKKWMQELESRSEQVANRNKELHAIVAQLREESMFLRNQLLAHGNCNCSMVQTYLRRSSAQLTSDPMSSTHHATAAASAVAEMMHRASASPVSQQDTPVRPPSLSSTSSAFVSQSSSSPELASAI